MVPSTRKRKESLTSLTLLDFFPSSDAIKRPRVRTSQQPASNVRGTHVPSREIIVVESDSDEDAHREEKKRSTRMDSGTGVSEKPQVMNYPATSTPTSTSIHPGVFGMPSELLAPGDLCAREASSIGLRVHCQPSNGVKPALPESIFGVPGPLLRNQPIEKADLFTHDNAMTSGNFKVDDTTTELAFGEWAIEDDDELIAPELSDNIVGVDKDVAKHSDEQHFCPVCGINLARVHILGAEIHVNQCLDTSPQKDCFVPHECTSTMASTKSDTRFDNGSTGLPEKVRKDDLYAVLMNSYKENEYWVGADVTADRDFGSNRGNCKKVPFYKVLQGMPIAVDAFCYGAIPGITAYFLSHAHSDHYTSLGSKWKSGPIYCSEETASLIIHMLAVDPKWIHPLPLDTPIIIPDTGGVAVTLIEANHCPGSCLFFFEGRQTVQAGGSAFKSPFTSSSRIFRYLHCGDFRASPCHTLHPAVKGKHIDDIYLDTTYLDPKYTFSPQPLVISACAKLVCKLAKKGAGNGPDDQINRNLTIDAWMKSSTSTEGDQRMLQERILVIVGTYSIGKERIIKAIAQALEAKIYCDTRKSAILRCQADKELHALLAADPAEASVHLLPLAAVTSDNLRLYLQRFRGVFSRVVGFRPTGWTYSPSLESVSGLNTSIQSIISLGQSRHFSYTDLRPSRKSSHDIQIFGVPYSEHSSFFELTCFAMSCDWDRMIPTVNVCSPASRAKMAKWLKRWEAERRSAKPLVIQPRTPDYW